MSTLIQLAAAVIASYEGLRLKAYTDSGGVWTIGFGSTEINNKPVVNWQTITRDEAEAALENYLKPIIPMVASYPLIAQAYLLSFAYNCGQGSLKRVLASKDLPDGDVMKVDILHFNEIRGIPSDALTRRRTVEKMMIEAAS